MYRSQSLGILQIAALLVLGVVFVALMSFATFNRDPRPQGAVVTGARLANYPFDDGIDGWREVNFGAAGAFYWEPSQAVLAGSVEAGRGFLTTHTTRSFTDTVTEATLTQPRTAQSQGGISAGLTCRTDPDGNGYYFLIANSGRVSIRAGLPNQPADLIPLVDWTPSTALRDLADGNHLRVTCAGNYLALYVNGTFAADVRDTRLTMGGVGVALAASPTANAASQAYMYYDAVQVWGVRRVSGR